MVRQFLFLCHCFQTGDQTFQYQGSLSGTGFGDDDEDLMFLDGSEELFSVCVDGQRLPRLINGLSCSMR